MSYPKIGLEQTVGIKPAGSQKRSRHTTYTMMSIPNEPEVDPNQRLIDAIILQAVRDLKHSNKIIRDDAKYFFESSYGKLILSLGSLDAKLISKTLTDRGLL